MERSPLRPAWSGVFPAAMTQFGEDLSVDHAATAAHLERLLAAGCRGLIMLGTLGENTSLSPAEKVQVLETAVAVAGGRAPVLAGVAEYTTAQAADHARAAAAAGCAGLMVLPGMVYRSDPRGDSGPLPRRGRGHRPAGDDLQQSARLRRGRDPGDVPRAGPSNPPSRRSRNPPKTRAGWWTSPT